MNLRGMKLEITNNLEGWYSRPYKKDLNLDSGKGAAEQAFLC